MVDTLEEHREPPSVVPSRLFELLELYEAAERALCDGLQARRLGAPELDLPAIAAPVFRIESTPRVEPPPRVDCDPGLETPARADPAPRAVVPLVEVTRPEPVRVNPRFDPVKASEGHSTKRRYNYFAQLALELESSSADPDADHAAESHDESD